MRHICHQHLVDLVSFSLYMSSICCHITEFKFLDISMQMVEKAFGKLPGVLVLRGCMDKNPFSTTQKHHCNHDQVL